MSVATRTKELRKALGLTQQEFANRLHITRGADLDITSPSDAAISLICREFDVNEDWLRSGEGEMFEQLTEDEDRARFFGSLAKGDASPEVLAFIDALRKTPESAIRPALQFIREIYESYNALQKEKGSESK